MSRGYAVETHAPPSDSRARHMDGSPTTEGRAATPERTAVRAAGAWLVAASVLMLAALVVHGPIAPDHGEQMARISGAATRWRVVHWIAAAALSLYALTGLLVLTSRSRLTANAWTLTAWGVLSVGALWTVTTAVAEATVVTAAAISGSRETFEAWWAFAEGNGTGFSFLALAVAVIAASEARSPGPTMPRWSAWIGVVAGFASFAGWAMGMWLQVPAGRPLWVASSILMSLWTMGFGVGLVRLAGGPPSVRGVQAPTPQ